MSGRILAIDYGERRLGLALSDPSGSVAHPLSVIDNVDHVRAMGLLGELVEERSIVRIIVGDPRTLSGQAGAQAARVKSFVSALAEVCDVPIDLYDERLSSKEARAGLAAGGVPGRKMRGLVDKLAAAIFLQSYLDREIGRRNQ